MAFEGPGAFLPWLTAQGFEAQTVRVDRGEPFPPPDDLDGAVVLGGPMGVHDPLGWLAAERAWVRALVDADRGVLGVCLGAQQLALALGGSVGAGPEREIGWWDVQGEDAAPTGLAFPSRARVFHWHGDACTLPPGATRLASSPACPVQAFQAGPRVVGVQFHLETTPAGVEALLEHTDDARQSGRWVQDPDTLRAEPPTSFDALAPLRAAVLRTVFPSA